MRRQTNILYQFQLANLVPESQENREQDGPRNLSGNNLLYQYGLKPDHSKDEGLNI